MALHFSADTTRLFLKGEIMRNHEHSASALSSASTLLPEHEVSPSQADKRSRTEADAFTKATIRKMQCSPRQNERLFWDAALRGFGIRALRSGRRSWIYQYRDEHGRTRRMVLGDVSAVSLALQLSCFEVGTLSGGLVSSAPE